MSQRWCKSENDPYFNTAGDRKGLMVKGEIEVRGSTYLILSVYAHQNNKREMSEYIKNVESKGKGGLDTGRRPQ